MRQSTQDKLFGIDDYTLIAELGPLDNGNVVNIVVVGDCDALIIEYADEADGFEVYIRVAGSSILQAREALGLE